MFSMANTVLRLVKIWHLSKYLFPISINVDFILKGIIITCVLYIKWTFLNVTMLYVVRKNVQFLQNLETLYLRPNIPNAYEKWIVSFTHSFPLEWIGEHLERLILLKRWKKIILMSLNPIRDLNLI